ncbi:MAG: dihydroorotase [Aeromonadaceae bacterium]
MTELHLTMPDDWHLHLRDGALLAETVPATARAFARAIVMPNLVPPVLDAEAAMAYRQRIEAARPAESHFAPLMTLYLTDHTTAEMIHAAHAAGVVAVKLYPAGATTHSDLAVTSLDRLEPVFEALTELEMPLLIHGEVTDEQVDIFDRERVFIERHLVPMVSRFPHLKVVMEHITTAQAVEFVLSASDRVAATITPQHLLMNRNHLLVGGIRPHNYCLPVLKRRRHQEALQQVAISGNPKFFLGTDSAPHLQGRKESPCGCAGCYSAPAALELYAEIFERLGALEKLEAFASHFGADFYGLPRNRGRVTLKREPWQVPERVQLADGQTLVPYWAGQPLNWRLVARSE